MLLDLKNDSCRILGRYIKLQSTTSGHNSLPLTVMLPLILEVEKLENVMLPCEALKNFESGDGKIIKIPRWEFIFHTCEDGAVWHLIPHRISPCSESFLGHIGTVGVNLGLD